MTVNFPVLCFYLKPSVMVDMIADLAEHKEPRTDAMMLAVIAELVSNCGTEDATAMLTPTFGDDAGPLVMAATGLYA